ncbi:MAG: hypothetical protein LW840_11290, partial [Gemmatimonas sp.]
MSNRPVMSPAHRADSYQPARADRRGLVPRAERVGHRDGVQDGLSPAADDGTPAADRTAFAQLLALLAGQNDVRHPDPVPPRAEADI